MGNSLDNNSICWALLQNFQTKICKVKLCDKFQDKNIYFHINDTSRLN